MNYSRKYPKKALEEKHEELSKLKGEDRVKLEQKIIEESMKVEEKVEEKKKGKK
jgi:hypothetical protein